VIKPRHQSNDPQATRQNILDLLLQI